MQGFKNDSGAAQPAPVAAASGLFTEYRLSEAVMSSSDEEL